MFVVLLNYTSPIEAIDELLDDHLDYLRQQYASGVFVLSGPQEPRSGGVIIARAASRAELEAILAQDPFQRAGVAEYSLIEFRPRMTAAGLEELREL
ncbi:MAG: YciI-like protein [Deltaproteobacteria bacterium ADurb.Bin510]|nr:MAG: YciI-like protein [Deltaproteobacteria bacterium ADurb.Bin510]